MALFAGWRQASRLLWRHCEMWWARRKGERMENLPRSWHWTHHGWRGLRTQLQRRLRLETTASGGIYMYNMSFYFVLKLCKNEYALQHFYFKLRLGASKKHQDFSVWRTEVTNRRNVTGSRSWKCMAQADTAHSVSHGSTERQVLRYSARWNSTATKSAEIRQQTSPSYSSQLSSQWPDFPNVSISGSNVSKFFVDWREGNRRIDLFLCGEWEVAVGAGSCWAHDEHECSSSLEGEAGDKVVAHALLTRSCRTISVLFSIFNECLCKYSALIGSTLLFVHAQSRQMDTVNLLMNCL